MDMAGFAINIKKILALPDVKMGFNTIKGHKLPVKDGYLENDYLKNFAASRSSVECRGSETEVGVVIYTYCVITLSVSKCILISLFFPEQ